MQTIFFVKFLIPLRPKSFFFFRTSVLHLSDKVQFSPDGGIDVLEFRSCRFELELISFIEQIDDFCERIQ